MSREPYALHWFRRDLRVAGNPSLMQLREDFQGRVLGIFCFDKKFLARPDFSADRFQFFLETLTALREEMRSLGSDLLFCDTGPDQGFSRLMAQLQEARQILPHTVGWNRDYEPFALDRDQRLQAWFHENGIHTQTERDHMLIEPHELVKSSKPSGPYKVYTPYSRKWLEALKTEDVQERLKDQAKGLRLLRKKEAPSDLFALSWKKLKQDDGWKIFEDYAAKNIPKVKVPIPPAGALAALKQMESFKKKLDSYSDARNIPSVDGTSRFSLYLKNGSLTIAQAIVALGLEENESVGSQTFLKELAWREFAYYILAKFPKVEREAFDGRFRDVAWNDDKSWLKAWQEGRTGFPIVDAGMRQLNETGWMHNRVRMIVASFLTKDLLLSWQDGEHYFMDRLLDGDLAVNNFNWQWSASTGCDAQPYFRIFNPSLQSKRFDPDGDYIRQYVPELKGLSARDIHTAKGRPRDYPAPIVDHEKQRAKTLALYKRTKQSRPVDD